MGESRRRMEMMEAAGMHRLPGGQIGVDLSKATQKTCECGCKYFRTVFTI